MLNTSMLMPGDFVAPVPIGVKLTLTYGDSGLLESVFIGHDADDQVPAPVNLAHALIEGQIVPRHIPLEIGCTWVKGVLFTPMQRYIASGRLPGAINDDLLSDVLNDCTGFMFLAGHVESTAYSFTGSTAIRTWLSGAKFDVLSGWLVPYNPSPATLSKLFNSSLLQFEFPLISGYMIHRQSEFISVDTGLHQFVVDTVTRRLTDDGYVVGEVVSEEGVSVTLDYNVVLQFHKVPATLLILDADNQVVFAQLCGHDQPLPSLPLELVCSGCGKTFKVLPTGKVKCDDPHCITTLYPRIRQFLSTLDLPVMEPERFDQLRDNRQIQDLPDVLLLPEYADVTLSPELSTFLRAVVPIADVSDSRVFAALTNKCRNNLQTLRYYLEHPDKIQSDLKLQEVSPVGTAQLVDWLSDAANLLTLITLLTSTNVSFGATDVAYVGPAMFRNRKIMITGKFNRGPEDFITAVLRSYSATVETHFTDDIDILLIGDRMENVSGTAIVSARAKGIPILHENEFFTKYDIDSDMAANL